MRSSLVALALAFAGACGAARTGPSAAPRGQHDLITRDEILSSTHEASDLFRAIQSLRPQFLAAPRGVVARGSSSSSPLSVYVDGIRQSGVDALRGVPASGVAAVRYLDPTASQSELGPLASGGALVVTMYHPPKEPF